MTPVSLRWAVRVVVLLAVAFNLVGYGLYRKVQRLEGEKRSSVSTERFLADAARSHRAAGLAELEAGQYSAAVRSFTQALKLSDRHNDCAELLRISKELEHFRPTMSERSAASALRPGT